LGGVPEGGGFTVITGGGFMTLRGGGFSADGGNRALRFRVMAKQSPRAAHIACRHYDASGAASM